MIDALLALAERPDFWTVLEMDSAQGCILEMRPPASVDVLTRGELDTACEVLADFADVKSRLTCNHSSEVAQAPRSVSASAWVCTTPT